MTDDDRGCRRDGVVSTAGNRWVVGGDRGAGVRVGGRAIMVEEALKAAHF
jgi:hypothetical protein